MAQNQVPTSQDLSALSKAALDAEIAKIRTAAAKNPTSKFALSNQHVLSGSFTPSACTGTLVTDGFVWWTLKCIGAGTDLSMAYAFSFAASGGPSFDVSEVTCEVAGAFVVDPSTISGQCNFSLTLASVGGGSVTLSLYSAEDQTFYGTLAGLSQGVGAAGLSGSGTLSITSTS